MKILLIEPDRLLADTYRVALESAGHAVVMCGGAQSAIFAADEFGPDAVVLELQLIGHSGLEFLYEFRSYPEWQQVPIVVLTHIPAGEFSASWGMLRDQLGITAYHYKPLTSLQALLRSVANAQVPKPAPPKQPRLRRPDAAVH
jgi:DNA-binding response OmpR family regulator